MKIAYNHLIKYIDENPSINEISNNLFQLGHEHEIENGIFDMEFTPNRGDCLSLNGLLRDLGVFYNVDINQDIYKNKINELSIDFENSSEEACPQISFLKLEIESLPSSYTGCLENYFCDLGINRNNFFTDVSNYISYETGQPTHCYDAKTINSKISFQEIDINVEFETLLNKKIPLRGNNAVFLQDKEVINLAGIMGGKNTSCSNGTKAVIVECAFFNPESIIGKSIKYDIKSDAAHKFERGVDPECHEKVLRRFIKIVSENSAIKDLSLVSYNYKDTPKNKILIDLEKINEIVGINIINDDYIGYLSKLGFDTDDKYINIPSYRTDIKTQNDLAEEVARIIGYNNIPISEINIPKSKSVLVKDYKKKIRSFLIDNGFYEVINSPFVNIEKGISIKVDNPLDSSKKFLRTNILNSLIDNLLFNERRQKDSIKLFEISDVYSFDSQNDLKKESRFAIIASGRAGLNYRDFSTQIDKRYISDLFKKAFPNQELDLQILSRVGLDTKINSEIIGLEIGFDQLSSDILKYKSVCSSPKDFIKYNPISELPSSFKDISFSVSDYTRLDDLQDLIFNFKHEILKDIYIFDFFKNDKKSEIKIGFRFTFQSGEKTVTSTEIDQVLDDIIHKSIKIKGILIPGLDINDN